MTTIEEAAEKYIAEDNNNRYYDDFISGAKWQEEQQDKFAIEFAVWIANNGYHPEHYYKHEHFKELLNEFKNR